MLENKTSSRTLFQRKNFSTFKWHEKCKLSVYYEKLVKKGEMRVRKHIARKLNVKKHEVYTRRKEEDY